MDPLIEMIILEIRRLLIERVAYDFMEELTLRDIFMMLLGMLLTLVVLEITQ